MTVNLDIKITPEFSLYMIKYSSFLHFELFEFKHSV